MQSPKTILVPTDFGEPSEAALETAIEYAKVFGAEIVLMHAFEIPIVGFPDGAIVATAELTSRILEGAQAGLDHQIAVHQGCGVVIRGVIKQGDPFRMVNETADEVGAGLIALGTHGRKGLSRALLGSVAEKVVRSAHVPVLTVHPPEQLATRAPIEPEADRSDAAAPAPISARTQSDDARAPLRHR